MCSFLLVHESVPLMSNSLLICFSERVPGPRRVRPQSPGTLLLQRHRSSSALLSLPLSRKGSMCSPGSRQLRLPPSSTPLHSGRKGEEIRPEVHFSSFFCLKRAWTGSSGPTWPRKQRSGWKFRCISAGFIKLALYSTYHRNKKKHKQAQSCCPHPL